MATAARIQPTAHQTAITLLAPQATARRVVTGAALMRATVMEAATPAADMAANVKEFESHSGNSRGLSDRNYLVFLMLMHGDLLAIFRSEADHERNDLTICPHAPLRGALRSHSATSCSAV